MDTGIKHTKRVNVSLRDFIVVIMGIYGDSQLHSHKVCLIPLHYWV